MLYYLLTSLTDEFSAFNVFATSDADRRGLLTAMLLFSIGHGSLCSR